MFLNVYEFLIKVLRPDKITSLITTTVIWGLGQLRMKLQSPHSQTHRGRVLFRPKKLCTKFTRTEVHVGN